MEETKRSEGIIRTPGSSARPGSHPESPAQPRRRSSRQRSSTRSSASAARRGLRAGYFALASLWGCLAGTGVLVVGLSAIGRPLRLGPTVAAFLGLAVIIAIVGGLLTAAAYRAASRRYR